MLDSSNSDNWSPITIVFLIAVLIALVSVAVLNLFLCLSPEPQTYRYLLLTYTAPKDPIAEYLTSHLKAEIFEEWNKVLIKRRKKLTSDEWNDCERFGGNRFILVRLVSGTSLQCSEDSSEFINQVINQFDGEGLKVGPVTVRDKTDDTKHIKEIIRLKITGTWLDIWLLLDKLSNNNSINNAQKERGGVLQSSFQVENENTRLLKGSVRSIESEKHRVKLSNGETGKVVPQSCKDKLEALELEHRLHLYIMEHHHSEWNRILDPKPFSLNYKSGFLKMNGPSCMVSKAAEELANLCQNLTGQLDQYNYVVSDDVDVEKWIAAAGLRVAKPSKTLILDQSGNCVTLYGPRDRSSLVKKSLKDLEKEFRNHRGVSPEKVKQGNDQIRYSRPAQMNGDRHANVQQQNGSPTRNLNPTPVRPAGSSASDPEKGYNALTNGETCTVHVKVSVYTGDLMQELTDAIVNPANEALRHGGGAAKAIASAAGPELVKECDLYIKANKNLRVGGVMHTTSGRLRPRIKFVIHAVGPSAKQFPSLEHQRQMVEETFYNCLVYANDNLHIESISIPAISSGIFGVSKNIVAQAAHAAVKRFEKAKTGEQMTLERVNFVNIDNESTEAFKSVFEPTRTSQEARPRSASSDQPKRKRALKSSSQNMENGVHDDTVLPSNIELKVGKGDAAKTPVNNGCVEDCVICMEPITDPKALPCGHKFCADCIKDSFEKCQPKCPSCGRLFGVMRGNQPPGTMNVSKDSNSLAGYEKYGRIIVQYSIPSGIQDDVHPNPGQSYHGTHRTAFLPDNAEGREVCDLLRKAFDAGLIFTVGRSNTTGRDNQVIWNDIHHKTDDFGPYGYPDPGYLQRVKDELSAKGIGCKTKNFQLSTKQTAI